MAQGKVKIKTSIPSTSKKSKQKGPAVTKRANRPQNAKRRPVVNNKKITSAYNKLLEEKIRTVASKESEKQLSDAQKKVADYHQQKPVANQMDTTN